MAGITSYAGYVPYARIRRSTLAAALNTPPGPGSRAVAGFDEDTTTMAVEAGRLALGAAPAGVSPRTVLFSTTVPAYQDKANATTIHAALDLDADVFAADVNGSVRSGTAAMRAGLESPTSTLVTLADIRTGLPGSADERDGGDAAAAFLFGDGPAIADFIGGASATGEFLDRWRTPGDVSSRAWEERFGEHAYAPHVQAALQGIKDCGVGPEEVDHLVVSGLPGRAVRSAVRSAGIAGEAVADDLSATVGNSGTAHPGLLLAAVLDRAKPGDVIAVVTLSDGCDVLVFRATDRLASFRPAATVAAQVEAGRGDLDYLTFLTWRGLLRREPPRRPDPSPPAAPPALRGHAWKFAFTASRCQRCSTRHLPPQRVCLECNAADEMTPERLADTKATIATHTIDRLAFSPSPPVVVGVLDFDGGGRYQCELTDVDAGEVAIGDRVEMTFRKMFTADGVHNYFWKARPIRGGS